MQTCINMFLQHGVRCLLCVQTFTKSQFYHHTAMLLHFYIYIFFTHFNIHFHHFICMRVCIFLNVIYSRIHVYLWSLFMIICKMAKLYKEEKNWKTNPKPSHQQTNIWWNFLMHLFFGYHYDSHANIDWNIVVLCCCCCVFQFVKWILILAGVFSSSYFFFVATGTIGKWKVYKKALWCALI